MIDPTIQRIIEQLAEISARTRRTETGMHKLREHFGLVVAGPNQAIVTGHNTVRVQGYDVTLSQINRAIDAHGLHGDMLRIETQEGVIAHITFVRPAG